jgi:hypothetical protein
LRKGYEFIILKIKKLPGENMPGDGAAKLE